MAIHELATNAAKYGALSNASGAVSIEWQVDEPAGLLTFQWHERDGPPVQPPAGKGFGSVVLEHVMADYLSNAPLLEFDPQGVRYEAKCPMRAIAPE